MMAGVARIAFLLVSYLIGSLPIVFVLGKLKGVDLRRVGTRNVGGGNLWQVAGPLYGILGGLSDVAKGAVPPLLARRLGLNGWTAALGGILGVAGQCWPFFNRMKGGRGVSASLGMHLVMAPREFSVASVPMVVALLARNLPLLMRWDLPLRERLKARGPRTRMVPLAVLSGLAVMPVLTFKRRQPPYVIFASVADLLLVLIRRLTADLGQDVARGLPLRRTALYRLLYDRPYGA